MKPRPIWFVRHAPSAVHGVCYGQHDIPVTLEPSVAAARVAEAWRGPEPELWSSPWARCRLVAEELARLWQLPLRLEPRLSEISFGVWEGQAFAALERDHAAPFQHWMQNYETVAAPGGETVGDLRARVASWLAERSSAPDTGPVLALTHAGVIRTARAIRRNVTYAAVVSEAVPNLSLELWNGAA
jgi:alpha-ribazole phosphatase